MAEWEDSQDSDRWLLQGKFEPHSSLVRQVRRSELLQRLDSSLAGALTLVVTPAGYGKSTLLSQWSESLKSSGHLVSWLNADESDCDPHQFLSHLVLSMSFSDVAVEALEKLASQGFVDITVDAAIRSLTGVLQRQRHPLVIVIDDYHHASGSAVDKVIEVLLEDLPASAHIAISTRRKPSFRYSNLQVNGLVKQLSVKDLRFSDAEALQILPMSENKEELKILMERTEGWAMALQLICSLLRNEASFVDVIRTPISNSEDISDYFTQQIYEDLSDDIQHVLRCTSAVDRFNADLANFLSERIDCLDILEQLKQQHSLVISTEQSPTWYRYHHLFAEFLRNTLERTEPDRFGTLLLRAAQWHEAHELPGQAIKYACLSGNWEYAARIIEDAGGWELILFGGISKLRQFLGYFPQSELSRFPRLQAAQTYRLIKEGKVPQAHRVFSHLKEENQYLLTDCTNATAALRRDVLLVDILLNIYEDRITDMEGIKSLLTIENALTSYDSIGRSLVYAGAAVAALSIGAFDETLQYAKLSQHYMREINCVLGLNYILLHEGQANLFLGHLKEAIATLDEAREMAEDNFGEDSGLKSISEILSAAAHYPLGKAESDKLNAAIAYAEHADGWFDIYAAGYITAAFLTYAQHGLDATIAVLTSGRRTAKTRSLTRLIELLDACEYLFLVREGALPQAKRFAERTGLHCLREAKDRSERNWRRDHLVGLAEGLATLQEKNYRETHRLAKLLSELAAHTGNCWHALDAEILKALALNSSGQEAQALEVIAAALPLAVAENAYRSLLDFGKPLEQLLTRLYRQRRNLQIGRLTHQFLAACLPQFIADSTEQHNSAEQQSPLSQREQEVLEEVAQGQSNKGIGRVLDMTENTVKFHLKNIFIKLNVTNRVMAVSVGRHLGLIP